MSSKIFEEAIADAKKLREVAEDNAKKAILEAVTPKIRHFIEEQLLESSDTNEDMFIADEREELSEDVFLDEHALSSLVAMLGGDEILNSLSESHSASVINSSVKEAVASLSSRQRDKLLEIANKINNTVDNLANSEISNKVVKNEENSVMADRNFYEVDLKALREALEEDLGTENTATEGQELYPEEGVDEMDWATEDSDLSEMLQELRLVLDLGPDIEEDALPEDLLGMVLPDEDEEGDEDLDMDDEDEGDEGDEGEFEMPDFGDMGDEGEEPPPAEESYTVDATMLREELARARRMLREGNVDHHFGGKGTSKAGTKNAFGGSGKKNVGYKNAFGGGSYGSDPFENPPQINKLNEAIRQLRRMNRSQKEKLNKYRGAINTLREQLEDLNLFNAKLLYVNKLLQNKTLSESEKKSVIKALDEARTLREAKSLYGSLTETFGRGSKGNLTESRRYGSSSRATTSSSGTGRVNGELDRWQTLAGLK